MATAVRRRQRSYTEPEIERGLFAVALCGGNTREAARRLKAEGHQYPRETLRAWADQVHADRYTQIRQRLMPKIRKEIAAETLTAARKAVGLQLKLLNRLDKQSDELEPAQISQTLKNLGIAMGINVEKSNLLSDMPSEIREHRTFADLKRALQAKGVEVVIEGTAEEVEKG